MRVGFYFDGYNVYYGGRKQFGRGTPGWKWYSPVSMAEQVLTQLKNSPSILKSGSVRSTWKEATVNRVVFCSARIAQARDPQSAVDQNIYLDAIQQYRPVDVLELGRYVARIKHAPLAVKDPNSQQPRVVSPTWPVKVQEGRGNPIDSANFVVSYFHNEEKGSDVNLATHLLLDILTGHVDAAIVLSNDTDLALPIKFARDRVPVAVVNPAGQHVAGDLKKSADFGRGDWFAPMEQSCFLSAQMPDTIGRLRKPDAW